MAGMGMPEPMGAHGFVDVGALSRPSHDAIDLIGAESLVFPRLRLIPSPTRDEHRCRIGRAMSKRHERPIEANVFNQDRSRFAALAIDGNLPLPVLTVLHIAPGKAGQEDFTAE